MIVRAGIDSINKDKSVKLIDECLQEMIDGKFSEEDILSAKKARIHQVRMREDSTWSIINIQIASDLDDLLMGNKLIKEYKSVTKKEIVKLAKKLKVNTEYMLCKGDGNERD
jgi:predicted Zn-dependent peptidase